MTARRAFAVRLNTQEICASTNATLSTKAERHASASSGSAVELLLEDRDGQAPTALATTVRENLRSAARGHASEEAVRAEATRVVGLIRAFRLGHDSVLLKAPNGAPRGNRGAKGTTWTARCQGRPASGPHASTLHPPPFLPHPLIASLLPLPPLNGWAYVACRGRVFAFFFLNLGS